LQPNWTAEVQQLSYITQSILFIDYVLFENEVLVAKPEGNTAQMGG
jgi:hypothetical protein